MADVKEIRRQQLRKLVNEHEGMNNLARKLGLAKGAYISQLLVDPPHRDISEKTARKWEKILRLPEGWFDRAAPSSAPHGNGAMNTELLASVIAEVDAALRQNKVTLSSVQLADLVAMQYADAVAAGQVDAARIRKLVGFLKR